MRGRRIFLLIYACSGAAGLIYEIVWTRLFSLQLGHTVAAVGTVLGAFMGGLAAGALVGGHFASRQARDRALRIYAAIEIVIASCAVLLPFALHAMESPLRQAYGDDPGLAFALVRLASSLVLVFIPATAMGATFPFAIRWFVGDRSGAGRDAGSLYALNTVGAAVGALVTGFVLISAIGLRATTFVAIALNLIAAAGAWLIANRSSAVVPSAATAPSKKISAGRSASARGRAEAVKRPIPRWLPAALLGSSGFAALIYEVTFTRVLAVALG